MFNTIGEYLHEIDRVKRIQNTLMNEKVSIDIINSDELLDILDNYVNVLMNTKIKQQKGKAMDENYKEALFWEYCHRCKHDILNEDEEPCCDCLNEPVNLCSHKPIKFEEK